MTFHPDALAGQHIVLSGGCGAIGVVLARHLSRHGAVLSICDLAESAVPQPHFFWRADLTDPQANSDFVAAARKANGPIHTALCHLGVVTPGPVLDYCAEDWDRTFAANVKSAFLLGQAAARAMIEDGIRGRLIFTTSWVARVPWPEIAAYNASKAAMTQLMRSFARELAPKGIRANAIAPGIVGVGMARIQWEEDAVYRARAQRAIPLGSLQTPESVAEAFVFLCSPAADYMTGSVLLVDGGCSLYPMDPE
jgi:NAD(P)-dependent dehydrogenase (short-subunit alcohol dehydrogenase family)